MKKEPFTYSIGGGWSLMYSLAEARSFMRYLIKKDEARFLHRESGGRYYIVRYSPSGIIRIFYL